MHPKDLLDALMTPAGLCDPASLRLVWCNEALKLFLQEQRLEQNSSVRTFVPEFDAGAVPARSSISRAEASLPSKAGEQTTLVHCQLGPNVDIHGDTLLMFHLMPKSGSDSSRATLNIFSRHMNAQTAAWDKERQALLAQINDLKSKQS